MIVVFARREPDACSLRQPYETVTGFFGHALDQDTALATEARSLERWLFAAVGYTTGATAPEAVQALSEVASCPEYAGNPEVRRRLEAFSAVVLLESGRQEEAARAVERFEATHGRGAAADALRQALRPALPEEETWQASDVFGAGWSWAADHLEIRLARAAGSEARVQAAQDRLRERGRRRMAHLRALTFLLLLFFLPGLAIMLVWAARRGRAPHDAGGLTVAPWSLTDGYAGLVRAGVVAGGALALVAVAVHLGLPVGLLLLGTVWVFVPAVVLLREALVRPLGAGLVDAFGLDPPPHQLPGLLALSLGVTACALAGEVVLSHLLRMAGVSVPWTEIALEPLLHGRVAEGALSALDVVFAAPVLEEMVFRGVLYPTLRRRLKPLPAALVSSLLFGLGHMYSLAGLVSVVWAGFLFALAYEHTRSLVPAIAAHAAGNAVAVFSLMLLYA